MNFNPNDTTALKDFLKEAMHMKYVVIVVLLDTFVAKCPVSINLATELV
jgi:hypothetical protein